jgi:hypothetical protein
MEILLDKRAVKQIRLSAQDAVEEGDTETLRDDILDSFSEDQVEEIERRIDTDFYDFLGDTLEEWSGEDVDELFDLLESQLADVGHRAEVRDRRLPVTTTKRPTTTSTRRRRPHRRRREPVDDDD